MCISPYYVHRSEKQMTLSYFGGILIKTVKEMQWSYCVTYFLCWSRRLFGSNRPIGSLLCSIPTWLPDTEQVKSKWKRFEWDEDVFYSVNDITSVVSSSIYIILGIGRVVYCELQYVHFFHPHVLRHLTCCSLWITKRPQSVLPSTSYY